MKIDITLSPHHYKQVESERMLAATIIVVVVRDDDDDDDDGDEDAAERSFVLNHDNIARYGLKNEKAS